MKRFTSAFCYGFAVFISAFVSAENYYFWCQAPPGNRVFNTGEYWYDSTYTTPFSGSISFTSSDNIIREKSLTGSYQFSIGAEFNLNSFTHTGTGLGSDLVIYNSTSNTVSIINTVTQSADRALILRKRAASATHELTVKNSIVTSGNLFYGSGDSGSYLTNLKLTESVNISGGGALQIYALSATIDAALAIDSANLILGIGTYTGNAGSVTFNETITAAKSTTGAAPVIRFGQKSGDVLDYMNTLNLKKELSITDGSLSFNANSVNADLITATNTALAFGMGRDVSEGALTNVKVKKLDFSGSTGTHLLTMGSGSLITGVYTPIDLLSNFTTGDFDFEHSYNSSASPLWNLKEFKVKANAFTGATGTFNYKTGNTRYSIHLFANTVDIDNFNIGKDASGSASNIIYLVRSATDISGSSLKIGNFTGNEMSRLRVGTLYQASIWYYNNAYDTIDIGSINTHGEEVYLFANTINVGSLEAKASASYPLIMNFGDAKFAATEITIGKDNQSISSIDGVNAATKLNLRSNSITLKGTMTVKDGAHLFVDSSETTNFTAHNLVLESPNASSALFSNSNNNASNTPTQFNKLDVDSITLQNISASNTQYLNLSATLGSTVGALTIKSDSASGSGVAINAYKTVNITNLNVENGVNNNINLYGSSLTLENLNVSEEKKVRFSLDENSSYTGDSITLGYKSSATFFGNSGTIKVVEVDTVIMNSPQGEYTSGNTYFNFDYFVKLKVKGDFINKNTAGYGGFLFAGGLEVEGVLENNNAGNFVTGISTSGEFQTFEYSIGALKGASTGKIGTSPNYSNGAFNLTFTGTSALNENAIHRGEVSDVNNGDSQSIIDGYGLTRQVSLIINSSDGTLVQYLVGKNSIRGDTEVRSGTLIATTQNNTQAAGLGFSKVILSGGKLGACGVNETVAVGEIKMKSLEWSQGQILIDLDGRNADKFLIENNFSKGVGVMDKLEFLFMGVVEEGYEYNIISFDGTDFSEEDFKGALEGYNADFTLDYANGMLWVSFTAIPEPETYALMLGLISLLFIKYRRKK